MRVLDLARGVARRERDVGDSAFCGSSGSISPCATPVIFSYWPTPSNE
jgi:hypothetical protein